MDKFKENILKIKVTVITVLVSLLLSFFVLYTPKIKGSDVKGEFSAVRAAKHIEEISRKPHSYYDQEELEEVRVYLRKTLTTYLGSENLYDDFIYTKEYASNYLNNKSTINKNIDLPYDLVNIMGKIPGENKEGILLVAHYDSRGHVGRYGESGRSYGAMDDGYGVGSLLDLAYILKDTNPKNTIYFLFTDAEEVGLYGAYLAAQDKDVMDNVKFVINLESRGRYGPSYMFETSNNNSKVIDLYKKANLPITYSMATAVYSVMPNFTDFTAFIETGVPGLNFANLAGLDNYHSPTDSYENISLTTIQHMGSQVEPIIREFASDSKYINDNYFEAKNDKVFFTLFAGVLISYSKVFAIILALLVLVGFGYCLFINIKDNKIDKKIFKTTLPKAVLLSFILIISSYIFSYIVAFLGKVPFNITYVRVENSDIPATLFILITLYVLLKKIKNNNTNSVLLISVSINLLLTLLTTFFLPGASFLFLIQTLFGLLVLFAGEISNKYVKHFIYTFSILIQILILAPLIWSFYMALTIGGLAILILLLLLGTSSIIPTIYKQANLEINK